jgi:AcrR family transcriptional regulator
MKFGNLTYHYRTREDLVRELLESVIRAYEQEFVALAHQSGLNPAQRLERYCRLLMEDITTKKTTRLFPELWALANHDGFVEERVQEPMPARASPCRIFWKRCAPILPRQISRC